MHSRTLGPTKCQRHACSGCGYRTLFCIPGLGRGLERVRGEGGAGGLWLESIGSELARNEERGQGQEGLWSESNDSELARREERGEGLCVATLGPCKWSI